MATIPCRRQRRARASQPTPSPPARQQAARASEPCAKRQSTFTPYARGSRPSSYAPRSPPRTPNASGATRSRRSSPASPSHHHGNGQHGPPPSGDPRSKARPDRRSRPILRNNQRPDPGGLTAAPQSSGDRAQHLENRATRSTPTVASHTPANPHWASRHPDPSPPLRGQRLSVSERDRRTHTPDLRGRRGQGKRTSAEGWVVGLGGAMSNREPAP